MFCLEGKGNRPETTLMTVCYHYKKTGVTNHCYVIKENDTKLCVIKGILQDYTFFPLMLKLVCIVYRVIYILFLRILLDLLCRTSTQFIVVTNCSTPR